MGSVFRNETQLKIWLVRRPLIKRSKESATAYKTKDFLVNFNPMRKKFSEIYKNKFQEDPPKSTEIDLIYISSIYFYPSLKKAFPHAVEIKYFRKIKGRIKLPYYAGLDQILAYLKFGFQRTHLWHFFDPGIQKEEAIKYVKNLEDLLNEIQLPLPISYAFYLLEPDDEKREFNTGKLVFRYQGRNANWVNPYNDEEKTVFISKFILDKMISFRE